MAASESDLFFFYSEQFMEGQSDSGEKLKIPVIDTNIFCPPEDDNRFRKLLYLNRFPVDKVDFESLPSDIEVLSMSQPLSHPELAKKNMLSRFFGAPLVGAKIQQLLTDPRYNFRNEILDFNSDINFSSDNGKTRGALAPNEFWYFWRRFLPFDELDYMPADQLRQKANLAGFRDELNALANIFEKPFAMKAMIMNQNIPELAEQFDKPLFIWIRRDPIFNIQSALDARKRQHGDINTWYSFKIKEYPELKNLDPLESVASQIAAINRSVEHGIAALPDHQKLVVQYEDFCRRPEYYYNEITRRLVEQGGVSAGRVPEYSGEASFSNTNQWRLEEYLQNEATRVYEAVTGSKE